MSASSTPVPRPYLRTYSSETIHNVRESLQLLLSVAVLSEPMIYSKIAEQVRTISDLLR